MSGPSITWMSVPAPRGYLVNPYNQGDRMTELGKDTHHTVAVSPTRTAV